LLGRAGIAVVRISGPKANDSLRRLLGERQSLPSVRRASLRALYDRRGEIIDDALVVRFAGPNSFTGSDVVELNVHGSVAVVRDLLATLDHCDTLEPARAGEFTKQAFLNNRLDLTAVEGLADLIASETSQQRRQALRQLHGELGQLYRRWRADTVQALARAEALIDFGDDELIDESVVGTSRHPLKTYTHTHDTSRTIFFTPVHATAIYSTNNDRQSNCRDRKTSRRSEERRTIARRHCRLSGRRGQRWQI
jgi:tRNA U34 5-carboxymethylaminomethyl modifying GTPase MnmE/TrmE